MRTISSVTSRDQLVDELADKAWRYCRTLSPRTVKQLKNMSVNSIVMSVRVVEDPVNDLYDPIYEYDEVDNEMASEITEAVKDAGFLFIESRESYFIRIFLVKLLGETVNPFVAENYGRIHEYENRVQFTHERINRFSVILSGMLEPAEYEAMRLRLGLMTKKVHSFEECAKVMDCSVEEAKNYYNLAIAKLWGDKARLKKHYSWTERRKKLKEAKVAQKRLYRIYMNGGYMMPPFAKNEFF